jgi:hypothetical protein
MPKQRIGYKTNDLRSTSQPLPIMIEVKILEENRANIIENQVLFNNKRQLRIDGKMNCINAERHYKKDSVAGQITRSMVNHFNAVKLFKMTFFEHSQFAEYYLSGTLNSFNAQQGFSQAAAVGAQFGLIGALATAGVKTPGTIVIDISDLKLYKKDGTLVKDFGSFYKEYKDEFRADAHCWCAYWNANEMLKDFNNHLVEKIRSDLSNLVLQ